MTMEQNGSAESAPADSTQTAILESQMDGGQDTAIEGKGASFDDFEDMETARKEFIKSRTKKETKDTDEQVEEPEKKSVRGKEEKTKLLKDLEKESDETSREDSDGITQQKIKPYKAMVGDKAVDVDPNTKLKIPVDGQRADVSIRELVDNYNGKVAYDKRFNELNTERKTHQREKQVFQEQTKVFSTFTELAATDPTKAIMYALDTANIDPHTFLEKFRDSWLGDVEQIADLTPEERRAYLLSKENEFLKERTRTNLERVKEQQALRQLENRIDQVRQSTGLTESEFEAGYNKAINGLGITKPSIEQVAEVAIKMKAHSKTTKILETIHPQIVKNDTVFNETWKWVLDGGFSDDEIASLVRESLGMKAQAALKKAAPIHKPKTANQNSFSESDIENGFFSDYET